MQIYLYQQYLYITNASLECYSTPKPTSHLVNCPCYDTHVTSQHETKHPVLGLQQLNLSLLGIPERLQCCRGRRAVQTHVLLWVALTPRVICL